MSDIASGVTERQIGPCRLLMLRTDIEGVVTLRGSLFTWPDFSDGEDLIQSLAVGLLDKGTSERDKMEVARALENLGAGIGFSSMGTRVRFSARHLASDTNTIIPLIGEQLQTPAFAEEEFTKSLKRVDASLQRAATDTGYRADVALSGALLDHAHPSFALEPQEERKVLATITLPRIRQYHSARMAGGPLVLAAVGDLDFEAIEAAVQQAFAGRDATPKDSGMWSPTRVKGEQRVHIPVQDRPNLDVRLGHAAPIKRQDEDYLALFVGNFILGGNFSSRLMSYVRDERGLTYGIGSGLSGITAHHDGLWRISVTLSADRLEEGISATTETLTKFLQAGVTEEDVERAKSTLQGQYLVGLATTGGLAATLRGHAENGFPIDYIDEYPADLDRVNAVAVNESIRRYLKPQELFVVSAGTAPA